MELKKKLVELRRQKGLTQDELAQELGVTRQAVSKWERGVIAPATANLIALGRLYGIPLDELVNGDTPSGETAPEAAEAEKAPETDPPHKKSVPLKLAGAAVAAVLTLLVTIASVITIGSATFKKPEKPKDGRTIINQDDTLQEDINLTEVQDWTDSVTIINP